MLTVASTSIKSGLTLQGFPVALGWPRHLLRVATVVWQE
jgi:hypothetical protein